MILNLALSAALSILALYIGYRIFFAIRLKQMKERFFIELCPQCGSHDRSLKNGLLGVTPVLCICQTCGYQGTFVEVERDEVDKFRAKVKHQPHSQTETKKPQE